MREDSDNTLQEIFRLQGDFSLLVRNLKDGTQHTKDDEPFTRLTEWSRSYILAAHAELSEMLDMVPAWKPHRRELVASSFNRDGFIEEGVDVFNYLLSAMLLSGVDTGEFYEIWRGKLDVLNQRLYQEVLEPLQPDQPVVMLDIDGVLADWRTGLFQYAKLDTPDEVQHYAMDQDMGITPDEYRDLKERFQAEGGLRYLQRMPHAAQLVEFASRLGRIVVISSRPGDTDRKVFRDTLFWLKRLFRDTPFTLHFTRDKAVWLHRAGVSLVAAVEDEPGTASRLMQQFGHKASILVPAYGYNEGLVQQWPQSTLFRGYLYEVASKLEALSFRNPEETA